jgi:iron complex transport system substrate-binding protein
MPGWLHPFVSAAVAAAAAAAPPPTITANLTRGCVDSFHATADYFPDKARIESARGFSVEYRRSYKVLTVANAYPKGPAERYLLVQCGAPPPALAGDLAPAAVIRVPIRSMFSGSTTHLPLLVDLERLDLLTGVRSFGDVMNTPVLARIQAGKLIEFGSHAGIDAERVVASGPDLLMTGGDFNSVYTAIRGAGIPIVANAEWLEPTPLGRAEWVKYMGLFLNEERRANALYEAVRDRYHGLVKRTRTIPEAARPRIMAGRGPRGQFYIAGGRSYVAGLIKDAGGRYVWADNTDTGSPLVDLEAQLRRAGDADIWINGGGWKDRAAMLGDEPRYAEFKAFRAGQVWVYERRVNAAGANEYWSRSVTRPELVLADLIKIFHPKLLPNHDLEWYMPVPGELTR